MTPEEMYIFLENIKEVTKEMENKTNGIWRLTNSVII
jgi:hypothetical protein